MPCSVPRSDQDGWRSLPTDELLASKPPHTPPMGAPHTPPSAFLQKCAQTNKCQSWKRALVSAGGKIPTMFSGFQKGFYFQSTLKSQSQSIRQEALVKRERGNLSRSFLTKKRLLAFFFCAVLGQDAERSRNLEFWTLFHLCSVRLIAASGWKCTKVVLVKEYLQKSSSLVSYALVAHVMVEMFQRWQITLKPIGHLNIQKCTTAMSSANIWSKNDHVMHVVRDDEASPSQPPLSVSTQINRIIDVNDCPTWRLLVRKKRQLWRFCIFLNPRLCVTWKTAAAVRELCGNCARLDICETCKDSKWERILSPVPYWITTASQPPVTDTGTQPMQTATNTAALNYSNHCIGHCSSVHCIIYSSLQFMILTCTSQCTTFRSLH